MTITVKALDECTDIGMAKDILVPSSQLTWEFLGSVPSGLVGVDPNDWAVGTRLVIPSSVLSDRDSFPPEEFVRMRVTAILGGDEFVADVGIEFVGSPINMVVNDDFENIFDSDDTLVIDFENSNTADGIRYDDDGDGYIWEWEWTCVIPAETGTPERECEYKDGDVVIMPGETESRFEAAKSLEDEVPLFFSVRAIVRDGSGGEVVSEGSWSSTVNPVRNGASELEFEYDSWICPDSSVGYLVKLLNSDGGTIEESQILSLWSENQDEFGELRVLTVNPGELNDLTQISCSCAAACSEPLFLQISVTLSAEEHIVHFIYEPDGAIAPVSSESECTFYSETYDGNNNNIVSGLTMVSVFCEEALFLNGITLNQIWFQVNDGGDGLITNPTVYPSKENRFGPTQLILSCGSEVTIYSQVVGYGLDGKIIPSSPLITNYQVDSWTDSDEVRFDEAEAILNDSPSEYLRDNFDFASLQTTNLPCFPSGTFLPFDSAAVLEAILDGPVPTEVNEVLIEAAVLSVIEDPTNQDALIDRLGEYVEVLQTSASTDTEAAFALSSSITQVASNIIDTEPKDDTLDDVYELVEEVESLLLCNLQCGEVAPTINGQSVQVGAAFTVLEDVQTIVIGDVTFFLPSNLQELQDSLGGLGECVYVGYNLFNLPQSDVPTASLSFFSINCDTGEWEEVPITISDTFRIVIPASNPNDDNDDDCVVEETQCVSGNTLTQTIDTSGCEVVSQNRRSVVCECTHLTAFSALFVDSSTKGDGCEEWEWETIHTVAVSLLAGCAVMMVIALIFEHFYYW
eukprot:CAMPEP_0201514108 /NCGR_PEP_ID=MMETSP0161_2-20130828/6022_1 /ASSEMBLY_ACC=CAM_ASM_000251 /TAXON_ID=180227 /ORGANISM="Neoparamoeba aestuarina, Strain SoJaBio B1-5/56/2" /LENGTH=799 /DNA_ID=CAMNT_0047910563 /DNA_START=939 /DNA_END=3335 /DNA_ORIENTATION=+